MSATVPELLCVSIPAVSGAMICAAWQCGAQAAAVGLSHAAIVRHVAGTAAMRHGLPGLPPPEKVPRDYPVSGDPRDHQVGQEWEVRTSQTQFRPISSSLPPSSKRAPVSAFKSPCSKC